jgi:UDP-glucose 4-epimerase
MAAESHQQPTRLKGRKVLITGGLGFIGSNLAHRCVEAGAEVTIYDNLDPHSGGNLFNIEGIRDRVGVHFRDVLDFDALVESVYQHEVIFNCAASTSHPFSMREPWLDLDVNSRGALNLLEAIRRFNKTAVLVHVGTSTQLGRLHSSPADEHHPEFPTDIYSANKSASEKYVLVYAKAFGLAASVIRLSNVYGPRATIRSADFTFNNYFVGLALQDKDITVYGDGRQLRNVIFVQDAVSALMIAAEAPESRGETFFAVGDHHFTVADLAEATVRHMGSGRVHHVPWPEDRKAVDIGDAVISNAKIRRMLGWAPVCGLEEGLEKTREYYASCLAHYL